MRCCGVQRTRDASYKSWKILQKAPSKPRVGRCKVQGTGCWNNYFVKVIEIDVHGRDELTWMEDGLPIPVARFIILEQRSYMKVERLTNRRCQELVTEAMLFAPTREQTAHW